MQVHLYAKNLVKHMTQQKIADASKPHQNLIPVRKWGVPVCVRGVRQKKSHMGRHIMHNVVVRIWGLTYAFGICTFLLQVFGIVRALVNALKS